MIRPPCRCKLLACNGLHKMEVGGIEPPSEFNVKPSSTCVVSLLFLALTAAD